MTGSGKGSPKFWLEFRTFHDEFSSPPIISKPPDITFPQFAKLPYDLRIQIWSYLVQPRVITACCLPRDARAGERRAELGRRAHGPASPVLLRINRESRRFGLGHYELSFAYKMHEDLAGEFLSRPPLVWFNYSLDTLYLTGELEAYDMYGFNSPMVYFLQRDDLRRVQHVACPFADVGNPEQTRDQVLGCLWHIADRFSTAKRVLLTITQQDEEQRKSLLPSADDIMQNMWNAWMSGVTITTSQMADKQILLIREEELASFVTGHRG